MIDFLDISFHHFYSSFLTIDLILFSQYIIIFIVRSLDLFYKLFLIDTLKRDCVQLCPFVKNGIMHREFQKYLRPDGLGIDYSHLKNFDTGAYLEGIFSKQRPAGEKMIENAIKNNKLGELEGALENARRIGLDKTNKALYQKGLDYLNNN